MVWIDSFINLVVIFSAVALFYFKNYFKAVYLAFQLPGPPALPILGNVLLIKESKKLEIIGNKLSEMYSPVMRCWISIIPFFLIYEPKHLQILLSTNKYSSKNVLYTFLHNFIGDGLITSTGERWKTHRKLIQPCFHVNILKVFFEAFSKSSATVVKDLQNYTDVNIVPLANKFVLDVLQDAVLGIPVLDDPDASPYRKGKLFMPYRLTRPWLLLDGVFKRTKFSKTEDEQREVLQNYTRAILEKKRTNNSCNENGPKNNLIEMMIEIAKMEPGFTDDDIVNETCTFMLAGQDSVGAALTFSLYFLAAHQDVQRKIMDEINGLFRETDRPVTFDDVAEMKYLEQCIKEAMRLCPSVPIITRKLTEDLPLGKYVLPAGSNIFISPFATHRLPHIFPDPLKYDPDRFSADAKQTIHPYGYLPFSAGPRNCIGYKFALIELKTVISEILRNFHLSLTPGHEELNLSYRITLKAKNGIHLRLNPRKKQMIE